MKRFRRIFSSELKPVYVYSIILGLLLAVYFVINFMDTEKLMNSWGSFALSLVPASLQSSSQTDAPEQIVTAIVNIDRSLKAGDSGDTEYDPVYANLSDAELSRLLPGRWIGSAVMHDNRTRSKVEFTITNILNPDGSSESVTQVSDGNILTFSGRWRVTDGSMVWETLYSNQSASRVPYSETNRIIEMNSHMLVLQEKGFQSKWVKEE